MRLRRLFPNRFSNSGFPAMWLIVTLCFALPACRLGANNTEKLTALKSGEIYDEEGILTVAIDSPVADTLINFATNSASYPITGTCHPDGGSVSLQIDGTDVTQSTAVVCSQGAWNSTMDSTSLSEGTHSLVAVATRNGKSKSSVAVSITKNATLPQLAILSPANGSSINASSNSATFALSGTCTESSQTVSVLVDGGIADSQNGGSCNGATWAATISTLGLSAGAHTLQVSIVSSSGNPKTSDPVVVTQDITSPSGTITSPANSSYVNIGNNSASFAVSGTCNDATASVQVKVDGNDSGTAVNCGGANWNATISTVALSQGAHTLTAQVTDPAGNSATSTAISVTKDTSSPAIAITSPAASSFINLGNNSATFAIQGSCTTATENGRTITIQVDGANATQSAISCGASDSWSGTFSTVGLSEASHTLTATVSDVAGNSTTSTGIVVSKDVTAPTVTLTYPMTGVSINPTTNSATYSVKGACSENTRAVSILVDGSAASGLAANTCASGSFTATIDTTGLSDAFHTITATQTDAAGNSGPATPPSVSIEKDVTLAMGGTFTRTSVAVDPYTGTQAASGAARYANVGGATGIVIEEGTTNLVDATNIVARGTGVSVADTADTVFGMTVKEITMGGTHQVDWGIVTATNAAAASGTVLSASVSVKHVSGTDNLRLTLLERDSSQVFLRDQVLVIGAVGSADYTRISRTFAALGANTAYVNLVVNGSTSAVYRAGALQLEAKSYASSYVNGTRSPEKLTIPAEGSIQASQGAVVIRAYVDGDAAAATAAQYHVLFGNQPDGSNLNRITLQSNPGTPATYSFSTTNSSGTFTTLSHAAQLSKGWHLFGIQWAATGNSMWIDGTKVASGTSANVPSALQTLSYVGRNTQSTGGHSQSQWNHPIDYAAFYQHAPTETEMDAFTTTGPTGADNRLDFGGVEFTRTSDAYRPDTLAVAASGAPRYPTIGGATGLIVEEGTTNIKLYSEVFENNTNRGYSNSSVTANDATAPDGTLTADRMTSTAAGGYIADSFGSMTAGSKVTGSVYVKKGDSASFYLGSWDGFVYQSVIFNLDTLTLSGTLAPVAGYQDVGNGWYRVWVTRTLGASSTGGNFSYNLTESGKYVYLWGSQIEAKAYPTSYVKTTSSTATRSAENLSIGSANLISATQGAVRARFMTFRPPVSGLEQFVFDAGSTGATGLIGGIRSDGKFYVQGGNGTTTSSCSSTTVAAAFTWYTLEFRWSATSLETKVNGTSECTLNSFTNAISLYGGGKVHLGSHASTQRYLDGVIDWMEFENSDGSTQRLDFSNSLGQ